MIARHGLAERLRLLAVLAWLLPALANAVVTANIDRDTIAMGESLTLMVSTEGNTFASQPDFSALNKDFEIAGGVSRGSQVSIVNGQMASKTTWQVMLLPRRTGMLEIPALAVGNEQTNVLKVQVRAASASGPAPAGNDPVTLVATVDASTGLLRGQRILTLRGWFSVGASDVSLEAPASPDFQIVSLGDPATFARERNGRQYQVIEALFAVFPLHTGRVVIPAAKLNAVIAGENAVRGFFRIPTQQRIQRLSSPIALDVEPVPVAGLPVANAVAIDTDWSTPPDSLRAGEPVTLTLTVTAKGALPDAMPAADIVVPDTVRRYVNPAKRDSSHGPEGLVTTVTSTIALIPQFGGRIDMPPIELRWWDAKEGHEKTTRVALPPLIVSGAAATLPSSADVAVGAGGNNAARVFVPAESVTAFAWPASPVIVIGFIALLTISLLANAVLGWLLWRHRQAQPSTRAMLRALHDAVATGDAARTRDALLAWVRQLRGRDTVNSLDDVARLLPERERGLAALEAELYGHAAGDETKKSAANWRELLANISDRDLSAGNRRVRRQALPPLYPPAS